MFEPGAVLGGGLVQVGGAFATFAIGHLSEFDKDGDGWVLELVRADSERGHDPGPEVQCRPHALGRPTLLVPVRPFVRDVRHRHRAAAEFRVEGGDPGLWLRRLHRLASRLQENRHYLSDVVFGAALGVVAGRTVTIGHGNKRFALAPIIAPGGGGGGVGVTLIQPRQTAIVAPARNTFSSSKIIPRLPRASGAGWC